VIDKENRKRGVGKGMKGWTEPSTTWFSKDHPPQSTPLISPTLWPPNAGIMSGKEIERWCKTSNLGKIDKPGMPEHI